MLGGVQTTSAGNRDPPLCFHRLHTRPKPTILGQRSLRLSHRHSSRLQVCTKSIFVAPGLSFALWMFPHSLPISSQGQGANAWVQKADSTSTGSGPERTTHALARKTLARRLGSGTLCIRCSESRSFVVFLRPGANEVSLVQGQ